MLVVLGIFKTRISREINYRDPNPDKKNLTRGGKTHRGF
jgi:hypothetical protein